MMIAIPLGYFVSIFLMIAGFMNGAEFLTNRPSDITRAELLAQLSLAAWPLIAGTCVLLLIQIAKQIENLRLEADYLPEEKPAPKKKKKVVNHEDDDDEKTPDFKPVMPKPEPKPEPTPKPMPAPASPQNPAPPTVPDIPVQPPVKPIAPEAAPIPASSTRTPLYPNSPIPGGGRVPQAPPPMPPQADGIANLPSGGKRAPRKGENQGLSFFKVD